MSRRVILYILLAIVTIALGLFSRSSIVDWPWYVSEYVGDSLWAMMVFWGCCIVRPDAKSWQLAGTALWFCYAVELSQLYHAPWIDEIRHTRMGSLILGFGFKPSNLICYTAGVTTGAVVDHFLCRKQRSSGH